MIAQQRYLARFVGPFFYRFLSPRRQQAPKKVDENDQEEAQIPQHHNRPENQRRPTRMKQPIQTPGPIAVALSPTHGNTLDTHAAADQCASDGGRCIRVAASTNDLFNTLRIVVGMAEERHHCHRNGVGDESTHTTARRKLLRKSGHTQPSAKSFGGELHVFSEGFQIGLILELLQDC